MSAAARYSGTLRRRGIRWDRVSRVALLATLGIILLLYLSPAKHWIEQSRTKGAQQAELKRLQAEHERLVRRVRALRNPAAVEREARRLGMVKRGERAYSIQGLPKH
jgi:cell division protein FtsB